MKHENVNSFTDLDSCISTRSGQVGETIRVSKQCSNSAVQWSGVCDSDVTMIQPYFITELKSLVKVLFKFNYH